MIFSRYLFAFFIFMVCHPAHAQDDAVDWRQYNTVGLYKEGDEGFLSANLWDDYDQDKAVQTLSLFPDSLHNAAYRSVMRKILLRDSRALNDREIETPEFLAKRLEMLIQYGLFEDTLTLLDKIPLEIRQRNFELALIDTMLTLKNGDLAPACLDIQAASTQFRDMPAWRELTQYCRIRFGGNEKIEADELDFDIYSGLKDALTNSLDNRMHSLSPMEMLVAFADNQFSRFMYDRNARRVSDMSDLFVKLALDKQFQQFETYQCFVIEAADRGLINRTDLESYYKSVSFDEGDLMGQNQAITIHPCHVPAFFFQRFTRQNSDTIGNDNLSAFFEATEGIPLNALTPFASFFTESSNPHIWRESLIKGLAGVDINENDVVSPLRAIQKENQLREDDIQNWIKALKGNEYIDVSTMDFAVPIYYLRSLAVDFKKFSQNRDVFNYENLFSLTYAQKSLHSGIGKLDAMSAAHDDDDVVRLFAIAFSPLAKNKPNTIHPHEIAGILSTLNEYKLKKEKDMLAFAALDR
jgi:hypothetical protein